MKPVAAEKRVRLKALEKAIKWVRNDFKKAKDEHIREIVNQEGDNLHPQGSCSQHTCKVKWSEHKIDIIEHRFYETEKEVERQESMMEIERLEEERSGVFDIEKLPIELVMEIFKYLDLRELCQVSRVCKTWYELTRSRVYWERIEANIYRNSLSIPEATYQLMSILPSFITHISLFFETMRDSHFIFNEFSKKLREKCPNLQNLVLHNISFQVETDELVQLCTELPKNIRVLALPYSSFFILKSGVESEGTVLNIEVLDLSQCNKKICNHFTFNHMPNLKKLHLAGWDLNDNFFTPIGHVIDQLEVLNLESTPICDITFRTIINHSQHLTELYVCWTMVGDRDLVFIKKKKIFPCLKIICLRGCDVTTVGVFSLIKSCPTLQKIFVGRNELTAENDASWNSEKVEDLGFGSCEHSVKANHKLE